MDPKFMYLRASRAEQPIGCVAYSYTENKIRYQLSITHPSDVGKMQDGKLWRFRARDIASKRLDKSPIVIDIETKDLNHHEILHKVMVDMTNQSSTVIPTRAKKTANRWFSNLSQ